jgi:DNA-binding NarL/FixJ family response regulator
MTISVVLADDQALVRTGFRMILAEADDIEVVGEAADGGEAVRVAASAGPDVVLMDVRMPGADGIAAIRRIRAAGNAPRVLILTTFDLDEYVYAGLRAGPAGSCSRTRWPPSCSPRCAWPRPARPWWRPR